MAPKTSEQFEEIREARKKQIMEVALRLFAESGYSYTSISRIATEAGISKGLLYNYFESKEDLLIKLFEHGIREWLVFFDPNQDGVLTREEYIYFIEQVFNIMKQKVDFYKLYFSVMMQPQVMKLFESHYMEILHQMIGVLSDYYARKGSANPLAEAMMVGAMFDGVGFNFVISPDKFPLEEVKQMIIDRFV